jgi:hypothetical protein
MNGIADSYAEASDDDLLQEARDAGIDIEASTERLKTTMLDLVTRHKRLRLAEARSSYESAVRDFVTTQSDLPTTTETRRTLFGAVMRAQPELQGLLTAQFRDLDTLSDADIESCLRQFHALGILDMSSKDPE